MTTVGLIVWMPASSGSPTTGASQFCRPPPRVSRKPETTEPTASTTIGPVMVAGDSCGCTSAVQRRLPKKVMAIRRVM